MARDNAQPPEADTANTAYVYNHASSASGAGRPAVPAELQVLICQWHRRHEHAACSWAAHAAGLQPLSIRSVNTVSLALTGTQEDSEQERRRKGESQVQPTDTAIAAAAPSQIATVLIHLSCIAVGSVTEPYPVSKSMVARMQ